jgi:ankyrin repeat protein
MNNTRSPPRTSSPTRRTTSPTRKTTSPSRKTISPTRRTTSPRQTTSPSRRQGTKRVKTPRDIFSTFLTNDTFYNRLIKDPSLKRLNIDPINDDFTDRIKEIFIKGDPTDNHKYLSWILEGYRDGGIRQLEDVPSRVNQALSDYITLQTKKVKLPGLAEICGIVGCKRGKKQTERIGLEAVIDQHQDKLGKTKIRKLDEGEAELYYEDDNIKIIIPRTERASCKYGAGTKWCTAAKKSNMFEEYNKDGSLYIIIPKGKDKFQIHFESNSFMNKLDNPVTYEEIKKYLPTLSKVFGKKLSNLLVFSEDIELIKYGLRNGADINVKNKDELTPLLASSSLNDDTIEKYLVDQGADLNIGDIFGNTALMMAIHNDEKMAKYLVEHGADVNVENKYGDTALILAVNRDNDEMVKYLLKHGADVNIGNKALLSAIENENDKIVKYLLKYKADVNVKDEYGNTPLMNAISMKNDKIVKYLKEYGARK